ncbi:MAG: stress responsive protein [Bacteroidetes bacterium HGW-Bacteroidetes-16]|nr:MAG: stress responsive protein [Bacteroidetes bacterium HGW-Bacteroidetes-16]
MVVFTSDLPGMDELILKNKAMHRHVVMMKFSDRETWDKSARQVASLLNKLPDTVVSLKRMETGINLNTSHSAYDLVLTADFDNKEGLEAYRIHPDHVAILNYLKPLIANSTVVDYFIKL